MQWPPLYRGVHLLAGHQRAGRYWRAHRYHRSSGTCRSWAHKEAVPSKAARQAEEGQVLIYLTFCMAGCNAFSPHDGSHAPKVE